MDPNETLRMMQQAIEEEDWTTLRYRAGDLHSFLRRGHAEPEWKAYPEAHAYYLGRYGWHLEKNECRPGKV